MECRKIKKELSAYLDGMLDEPMRHRVEVHLQSCAQCREALETIKALVLNLGALPAMPAPADLLEKIQARRKARSSFILKMQALLKAFAQRPSLKLAAVTITAVLVVFLFNIQQKELQPDRAIHLPGRPVISRPIPKAAAPVRLAEQKPAAGARKKKESLTLAAGETTVTAPPAAPSLPQAKAVDKEQHAAEQDAAAGTAAAPAAQPPTLRAAAAPESMSAAAPGENSTGSAPIHISLLLRSEAAAHAGDLPSRFRARAVLARQQISTITGILGGKVDSVQSDATRGPASMVIRIPGSRQPELMTRLKGLGEIQSAPLKPAIDPDVQLSFWISFCFE